MTFCIQCGAKLDAGDAFCTRCGAMVAPTTPPPRTTPALVSPVPNAPAAKPTPWGKILAVLLVLVVLLVGSVIGGLVYVGYRVKHKAEEVFQGKDSGKNHERAADNSSNDGKPQPDDTSGGSSQGSAKSQDNPLAGLLGALGGGSGGQSTPMGNLAKGILEDAGVKNPDMPPDLIRNIPYAALTNPLPCPRGSGKIDVAGDGCRQDSAQAGNSPHDFLVGAGRRS